jgi:hypothetical protein
MMYLDTATPALGPLYRWLRVRFADLTRKGRWINNLKGVRLVPYHLPQFQRSETVYVVEGEKDAGTLEEWGFTATCNPMGARKWRPDFAPYFERRHVIIFPDNDDDGHAHTLDVAQNLLSVAASVRIVELPGVPEKGDVTDWKQKCGGTKEQLITLASQAQPLDEECLFEFRARWFTAVGCQKKQSTLETACRFTVNERAVLYQDPDPGKGQIEICSSLSVIAETRDDQNEGWGRLLFWKDRESHVYQWAMPMAMLAGTGEDYRSRLLDGGLWIAPGRQARELLAKYIQTATARSVRAPYRALDGIEMSSFCPTPVLARAPRRKFSSFNLHLISITISRYQAQSRTGRTKSANSAHATLAYYSQFQVLSARHCSPDPRMTLAVFTSMGTPP